MNVILRSSAAGFDNPSTKLVKIPNKFLTNRLPTEDFHAYLDEYCSYF